MDSSCCHCKRIETTLVHAGGIEDKTGSVSCPIYQTATFRHPGLGHSTGYDYSRQQNPTREALEITVAKLEKGVAGFALSSGMAAITTVFKLFSPGQHIIFSEDLYGGTYRLINDIYKKYGLSFSFVDTSKIQNVEEAIQENTAAFFIETPTNPMMKITDLHKLAALASDKGILTIVDNTFMTPYYQKPLELGADIVVHSGTKFLCGHNDTLAGFAVVNNNELAESIKLIQVSEGAVLSPFDSWLVLRGIKTLAVRLERQQQNALKVAEWLQKQSCVEKVFYVGLPDHPGYQIMKEQSSGFGSMISFKLKKHAMINAVLSNLKLITFAESLGGVESLITYPILQTHQAVPDEIKARLGIDDRLLRLSVGIEAVDDIIEDLKQAFQVTF